MGFGLKSLANTLPARYYRWKCGYAPTGAYLKRFGQRETIGAGSAGRLLRRGSIFLSLYAMGEWAAGTLEGRGVGNMLDSRKISTCADIRAVPTSEVRSGGYGLLRSHWQIWRSSRPDELNFRICRSLSFLLLGPVILFHFVKRGRRVEGGDLPHTLIVDLIGFWSFGVEKICQHKKVFEPQWLVR